MQPTDYAIGALLHLLATSPWVTIGLQMAAGGLIAMVWILRSEVEPDIPAVVELPEERTRIIPAVAAAPNYSRLDSDTHVLRRFVDAVEEAADETAHLTDEVLHRIADKLRGPVCPTCGGPYGNCSCFGQKDCPLTTQEIVVGPEPTPAFEETVRTSETQDLTVPLAKILEATK